MHTLLSMQNQTRCRCSTFARFHLRTDARLQEVTFDENNIYKVLSSLRFTSASDAYNTGNTFIKRIMKKVSHAIARLRSIKYNHLPKSFDQIFFFDDSTHC